MIQNLPKYLQSFPWDSELLRKGDSPLDYLWEFDLPEPPEELWSWLIDTSSFNRRIGVPEMFYKEINGKLFGKSVNAGFKMEWEEVPWEWEYCKSLNNARIYSKGLAKFVRTRYLLYPFQNGTKLIVYFGWIPRGILGRILISLGMKKLYLDYKKGLDGIILDLRKKRENSLSTQALFNSIQSNVNSNNYPTKLQQIANELIKNKCNPDLVHRIIEYILNEDENNLYRIRVKQLAMDWNIPLTNLLFIFLHGCRQGLFTLSWDIICPHCRGVRTEAKHLGDLPEMDSCEVCEIDFETNKLNSIEVCFHVHPSIREVQKRFFCAAEPATKQHIYLQKFLSPQETSMTQMELKSGTYRFRINGDKNFALGNIAEQEGDSNLNWNPSELTHEFKLKKDASIQLINPTNQKLGFIIESKKEDQNVLRPADLFNLQDFRDLFAEESLAQGLSLDIGLQTILFTDIVGSTKLYSQLGDGKAFEKVRSHFVHAYRIIQEGDGAVIKTIGDAVMASFPSSLKGVSASIHLQKFFNESTNPGILKIRTTLHTGPCLAVNLNTNIDYFGNTVNLAAKLQKVASDKEIVFTEAIFRDKEVRDYLLKNKIKLRKFPFHQDWEGSTIEIYKLPLE